MADKLMIALSEDELSDWLTRAKAAHTEYEAAFQRTRGNVPPHRWEDWYASWIFGQILNGVAPSPNVEDRGSFFRHSARAAQGGSDGL